MDLSQKRIIVTGGQGFLGKHVCSILERRGCKISSLVKQYHKEPGAYVVNESRFDLTKEECIQEVYHHAHPEVVIHLAAVVGGIGANRQHPGTFFYKNLIMGAMLMEHARHQAEKCGVKVEKFVAIGTICAYPKHTPVPFKEEDLWNGYPEETNAPYGLAKKMMLVQAQSYRLEFGFDAVYLLPVNLYGPGDNFNLISSHVIPALIRKCIEARDANQDSIEVWGTGNATREFLYVEDAAKAIIIATEEYDSPEPLNIGSGQEISIKDLAELIKELTGFKGEFIWNPSYPDGQPRRCLDTTRATQELGFKAQTDLREGILKTIEWYEAQ